MSTQQIIDALELGMQLMVWAGQAEQEQAESTLHSDISLTMRVVLARRTGRQNSPFLFIFSS